MNVHLLGGIKEDLPSFKQYFCGLIEELMCS